MKMNTDTNESMSIEKYVNDSYLDYSMYVIMQRSLPFIGDGLKPVHRRIAFAMFELRLNSSAKYKKSARTIGDVLGKYHPHGDSACYEAMVLMAQHFSIRTPIVDGQGNWGAINDPKSFAAMRYTESKLTQYSQTLLDEVNQDTVEWQDNFDGTLKEPKYLPAQLPNILINGSEGIAVGMACNVPSHNLEEASSACIAVMQKASTTDEEIMAIMPGPDYPTGGDITTTSQELLAMYKKGRGSINVRASYTLEPGRVIITQIPFQSSVSRILEGIGTLANDKKFTLITKILDDSDENNPVRIILQLKSPKVDGDAVMGHLYKCLNKDLEKSLKFNMNIIGLDGAPATKGIGAVIREWNTFRQEVFERKKRFRLRAVEKRLHIVEGLMIAYHNLDEIIEIIRTEDDVKAVLMSRFELSEVQVEAILELKLRQLAKLEEGKLQAELDLLTLERDELIALLSCDKKIKRAVIAEMKVQIKKHTTPRKSQFIIAKASSLITESSLVPAANVTLVLSDKGWIRAAKGHALDLSKLTYKAGDRYRTHLETRSNSESLVMGTSGRFFSLRNHELPNARSDGEPLSKKIQFVNGDKLHALLPHSKGDLWLISTAKGNGFIVPGDELNTRNTKGKEVLRLTEGDRANAPIRVNEHPYVALLTKQQRLMIIETEQINISQKSQGVKLMDIKGGEFQSGDDSLEFIVPLQEKSVLNLFVGKRKYRLDPSKWQTYIAKRARRGLFFEHRSKGAPLQMLLELPLPSVSPIVDAETPETVG
jgi:topoisomerase IV subunit A